MGKEIIKNERITRIETKTVIKFSKPEVQEGNQEKEQRMKNFGWKTSIIKEKQNEDQEGIEAVKEPPRAADDIIQGEKITTAIHFSNTLVTNKKISVSMG